MTVVVPSCRPVVEPDADSGWWWSAFEEGRLLCPHCNACGSTFFPPMPTCPQCGKGDIEPIEVSGRGTIYSWVVVHIALDPAFAGDVPYTILAVELEEGARLFGRLVGAGEAVAGGAVRIAPYRANGKLLPGFEFA
jgi:hypothetical protein